MSRSPYVFQLVVAGFLMTLSFTGLAQERWQIGPDAAFLFKRFRSADAGGVFKPKFVNYPLNTDSKNAVFNTAWDFRLQSGSPAIGKGTTTFTRLYADGLSFANGTLYKSPAPSTTIGAFGTN